MYKESTIFCFSEWITDDLMEKVRSHPNLLKKMSDPKCMQAITEFQANPKTAMTKYNDNPEIQQFLKDFCSILGKVNFDWATFF